MILTDNYTDIKKWSNTIIKVECDDCHTTKEIKIKLYTSYGYENGEYYCRKCKTKKNNIEKYGVDNVFKLKTTKDKIRETNIEKYGVDNVSKLDSIKKKKEETSIINYGEKHHSKSKEIKDKIKKTNLEKYGVDNVSKLEDIKLKKESSCIFNEENFIEKRKNIMMSKYGNDHNMRVQYLKDKTQKTNLERYGEITPSKSKNVIDKIRQSNIYKNNQRILNEDRNIIDIDNNDRIFKILCNDCNEKYDITYSLYYKRRESKTTICTNCNPINKNVSGKEISLKNYIKEVYDGEVIENFRLNNLEIDIYLPELKIGFEFNGIYYHSELHKTKNYHKNKNDMFLENNIKVYHIWEDEWDFKRDIVKSMISSKLNIINNRIHARKCEIKYIDNITTKEFLNYNHLQGTTISSIRIGLYYDNELVSLICFMKKKNDHYDLIRFVNKINIIVNGSFTKLLNFFIKNHSNKIYTFSDNSYSDGGLYKKNGFIVDEYLKVDYKYVINNIRYHKFNYRKNNDNLLKIYDCGKIKWKYDTNKNN